MITPGSIYNLLNGSHNKIMFEGAGSVLCSLTNPKTAESIGVGALLPVDDEAYDATDVLRGLPCFIGEKLDVETGMMVVGDQAEISVLQASVTIGRPIEGWECQMTLLDGTVMKFRTKNCIQDRTIGSYRIPLIVVKAHGAGRKIDREAPGAV